MVLSENHALEADVNRFSGYGPVAKISLGRSVAKL